MVPSICSHHSPSGHHSYKLGFKCSRLGYSSWVPSACTKVNTNTSKHGNILPILNCGIISLNFGSVMRIPVYASIINIAGGPITLYNVIPG